MVKWYNILIISVFMFVSCTHRFAEDGNTDPLANFEALWKIIDEKYCYLDEKQIDWDSIYTVYHARFDTLQVIED